MRRLLRSRPLAALVLALQLAFVAAPACAMSEASGHVHATDAASSAGVVARDEGRAQELHGGHAHHAMAEDPSHGSADDATAASVVVPDLEDDAQGASRDTSHPEGRCAAAMTCGTASLAAVAFVFPALAPVPATRLATVEHRLDSAAPEPDSPPPRG